MSRAAPLPEPQKLTLTHWLILVIAAIGFAFDIYELLMMPLIARPALAELLNVDPNTASGTRQILDWTGYILFGSAVCGGVFGLLGGYLTDWFGRRTVLTYSILLYALSALGAGFVQSAEMLLVLRCTTFIGVCVEFVAAVAWLAELFPNPRQREAVLGYTQAFSSAGGLLVTGAYLLINHFSDWLPEIYEGRSIWRYTLISGVIPALPLIFIRPFLPESPAWQQKRAEGSLKRPSIAVLFQSKFRRATLVTAALFACGYGAAFGAIQLTPQIVPGLFDDLKTLVGMRRAYEAAQKPAALESLKRDAAEKGGPVQKQYEAALSGNRSPEGMQKLRERVETLQKKQEQVVGNVQMWQELGGLVGRFVLAWLALRIVSRRRLLWIFQLPGIVLVPLAFAVPAAGNLSSMNLEVFKVGIFVAGFLTVAQFSFWGNYLPLIYPTAIRGTGESFAANVGGRMIGTAANPLATRLAPLILGSGLAATPSASIAYAAAAVALFVFLLGSILTIWLPEPSTDAGHD